MLKFILKKLLLMIPMLLVISLIVFFGLQATGIDPINFMLSPEQLSASPEVVEQLREELGLNDPLIVQYFNWLGNMLHGDFGYSITDGTSIASTLAVRMPYTLELAGYSLVLSAIIGIGIGIISAIRQNGIIDYIGRVLAVLGQAVPPVLVGITLSPIFSLKLGIFPAANRGRPAATKAVVAALMTPVPPGAPLTIGMVAVLMRYARNTMLDVLNSDYIKTARSKGIPEWKVYLKHGFRNAMKPVLVILMFRIPTLIGGSVVVESVFSYPGIGMTMTNAIVANDYNVVMVTTLIIAATMLVCSFMVDVLNAIMDPRVRLGE